MSMTKLRDEYVVQYNNVPEQYSNEEYWSDYWVYDNMNDATGGFWARVYWRGEITGTRIVHRMTQITEEIVEPAWKMEIEE